MRSILTEDPQSVLARLHTDVVNPLNRICFMIWFVLAPRSDHRRFVTDIRRRLARRELFVDFLLGDPLPALHKLLETIDSQLRAATGMTVCVLYFWPIALCLSLPLTRVRFQRAAVLRFSLDQTAGRQSAVSQSLAQNNCSVRGRHFGDRPGRRWRRPFTARTCSGTQRRNFGDAAVRKKGTSLPCLHSHTHVLALR